MMGMCINKKVVIGLAAVAGGVLLFAPQAIGAALPLLVVLVCPLSMVFMMRGMSRGDGCGTKQAGSGAASAAGATTETSKDEAELIALRAEVDQLRAEMRDRQAGRRAI